MSFPCDHADMIELALPDDEAKAGAVCEDCMKVGGRWVHLRVCLTCGHVACCDSSPHRHARAHAAESGHPIIGSMEEGEDWRYCFIDGTVG